jgi:hypothetical protein
MIWIHQAFVLLLLLLLDQSPDRGMVTFRTPSVPVPEQRCDFPARTSSIVVRDYPLSSHACRTHIKEKLTLLACFSNKQQKQQQILVRKKDRAVIRFVLPSRSLRPSRHVA